MDRERILTALLRRVETATDFATTGRRLQLWAKVAAQPALFVRHVGDEYEKRKANTPAIVTVKAEIWIYSRGGADPDAVPDVELNRLIDAVEKVMQPTPADATGAVTLGGLVTHCWIEGDLKLDPGDLDAQAIAIIPVSMLVPT